jgi:hypothetical protein
LLCRSTSQVCSLMLNMSHISVALGTSHFEMSHPANMLLMSVTLDTSHLDMSPLNDGLT